MISRNLLLCLGFYVIATYAELITLNVDFQWRYLNFKFDGPKKEVDAHMSGAYYFRNNVPYDMEAVSDGRIFVTIARKDGVPASLTTITDETDEVGGRLLKAYPNWSWTNVSDCDSIISVHRIAQDECNRLWVLDTGKVNFRTVCTPKLLAFDLTTDTLVKRVDIPMNLATDARGTGLLVNLVVDIAGKDCTKTHVYMADLWGSGMIIYDGKTLWRMESQHFKAVIGAEKFFVRGVGFEFTEGLLGMALTHNDPDELERRLYFRPVTSYEMHSVRTVELHSKKNDQSSIRFFTEEKKLQDQSVAMAFSSKEILFFSETTKMSIVCWNRKKPFIPENIVTVYEFPKTLQWASGVKVVASSKGEKLYVLTNRFHLEAINKMNYTRTNFRILSGMVDDLVKDTNCQL